MRIEADEPWPLPDDPVLAEWATAMRDMGDWGWIVDSGWNLRFVTDEQRLSLAADVEMIPIVIGEHLFGPEMTEMSVHWRTGPTQSSKTWSGFFANVGGWVLADAAGGKDELRSVLHPSFAELVDEPSPSRADTNVTTGTSSAAGTSDREAILLQKSSRIRDADGGLRGTAMTFKPAVGMNVLGTMALERDLGHVSRMRSVASARRRPAAILFADLEGSSALSRTLSTSSYFAAGRRIVRATDRCVVDAGGLVGRHVGDGVVASGRFVERLHPSDAAALGLDIDRLGYTRLSELTTATDKARRDAPAIAVCEV